MPRALRTDFEGECPRPWPFLNAETPEVQGTDTATLGRTRGWQPAAPVPPAAGHLLTPEGKAGQPPARASSWQAGRKTPGTAAPGSAGVSRSRAGTAAAPACHPWLCGARRNRGGAAGKAGKASRDLLLPPIPGDSGGSAVWNSAEDAPAARLQGWHIACQRPVAIRDTEVKESSDGSGHAAC